MKSLIFVSLLFISTTPALGDVYKCRHAGQVQYSDQPCGPKPAMVSIMAAPAASEMRQTTSILAQQADERLAREIQAADNQRQANNVLWEQTARLTRLKRQRRVGLEMTPAMVRSVWGAPTQIKVGVDKQGEWEKWIYQRDKHNSDSVKFRAGKVVQAD